MDQSEYMKGDIKDIINWNVKPRTKVPCDSPRCDSLNNEDGGESRESRRGSLFCGPSSPTAAVHTTALSIQEFYSPPLIHMAPREPPHSETYPGRQLTGPRVSTQPNQGQQIVSLRIWTWHQARRVALSLRAMFTEEDGLQRGRKDRWTAAKSWDQSAGVFPRSSCLPDFGLWDTLCGLFLFKLLWAGLLYLPNKRILAQTTAKRQHIALEAWRGMV